VIAPAVAGPFDLGDVVVRAPVSINPVTAQVSTSANAIPTVLRGVPLKVRSVVITLDRPGFVLNPTSCEPMSVTTSIAGSNGAVATPTSRFQVGGCAQLSFKPGFTAATSAKTSKANGASLTVKLAPAPGEANIHRVKVELPKILPSRLTTLQKACTEAQFYANPAGCPSASRVGMAIARTPILSNPLVGPAYFVSHGGAKFPELVMVLQGEGVTFDLAGETFISKTGITSSTFNSVPDVPVSTFELTLPTGRYSALAANGNLCLQKLTMPTEIVGQNGAVIKKLTPIEVQGCSNALTFSGHVVKKRKLSVTMYVPGPGRVSVSGKGLSSQAKTANARGALTFEVHEKKVGRLRTKVTAAFTPSTGKTRKRQVKSLSVHFKK
jgi:hypothetical protein